MSLPAKAARGFTLIELLIAIGMIVILVGGVAVALGGRGSEGAALSNAQSIVNGLMSTARAQAALYQTKARVVVYAQMPPQGDANKYLRTLIVLREDPADSTRYVAVGDPVTFAPGVCVVPPPPVPTTHIRSGVTWNNNVATGPVSSGLVTLNSGFSYRGSANATTTQFFGAQGTTGRVHYIEFTGDGTVVSNTSGNPTKIAVATAVITAGALPQFNNANGVRGLFVRKSGAISLVNKADGF